jgi:hypothetical protein
MFEWIQRAFRTPSVTRTGHCKFRKGDRVVFRGSVWHCTGVDGGEARFDILTDEFEIRKINLEDGRPIKDTG